MCSKASRILWYLQSLACLTFVCPILEYASMVWKGINKIEMVQQKIATFTLNWHKKASSVKNTLVELKGPPCKTRGKQPESPCYKYKRSLLAHVMICISYQPEPKEDRRRYIASVSIVDYRNYNFFSKTLWDWVNLFLPPWPKPTPLWQPKICPGSQALPSCMSILLKNRPTALFFSPSKSSRKYHEWSIFWRCLSGHLNIITIKGRTGVDPQ